MYQSKKTCSTGDLQKLRSYLDVFLSKKNKIYCRALQRKVSLDKLPEVLLGRRDAKRRLSKFIVAVDILRYSHEVSEDSIDDCRCFEIRGLDANGILVIVHLREERVRNDRVLYFVSCY